MKRPGGEYLDVDHVRLLYGRFVHVACRADYAAGRIKRLENARPVTDYSPVVTPDGIRPMPIWRDSIGTFVVYGNRAVAVQFSLAQQRWIPTDKGFDHA